MDQFDQHKREQALKPNNIIYIVATNIVCVWCVYYYNVAHNSAIDLMHTLLLTDQLVYSNHEAK